jgi:DNA-binding transcriptional regulator YiaG
LRDWLEASEFEGSVQRFAQALGVPLKTAEDWVYGRSMPSARNRRKVAKPEGAG